MKKIFWGMILVFLDFHIDIGTVRIGLIPTFIGYIFIIQGLSEMASESFRFVKAKPFAIIMSIYTFILYILDIFGLSITIQNNGTVGTIIMVSLGIIATIFSLYISYNIIMGIKEIEIRSGYDLNGESLFALWKILAITQIATYASYFINLVFVSIVGIVISFIVSIIYLFSFSKSKNLYYDYKSKCIVNPETNENTFKYNNYNNNNYF